MENRNKLVEIKRGQTGTGLLIESDGYVSKDVSENNKKIINEALESRNNGEWNIPNPFVMDVILQKFGIQNANGRIYPEHVLKREVEKYQKLIQDRMALGECYTPDVSILCENGWRNISEVNVGDNIITLNTDLNIVETHPVLRKIEKDYNDKLIHIFNEDIDEKVTPNHEFVLYDGDTFKFQQRVKAKELLEMKEELINLSIPKMKIEGNVNEGEQNMSFINIKNINVEETPYEGKVMCVEVENHTFYVNSNNKCHWTSNCNHPAETTIDLGRISHNIIECHWEGHTLVGKIEFNLTEGFRKYGICSSLGDTCANLIINGYRIGVSSRGVGSVENKLGKTIVQDDYEIVCWDIVATPSTPNAYIGTPDELQAFVEDKEINGPTLNETLSSKIYKIKNILK